MTQQQATDGMGKMELGIKRTADILFAMVGMVVLSPVMLAVALSIRLQQNGPIFFRQVRIGKGGKPFVIFKFRTLSSEAENEGPQLIAQGDELTSTRLERFLRGHHLDELPQLWNVLRGDMSLVGPRPERPELAAENEKLMPEFRYRLKVKAGLTGYAQVLGKYNTTPYDKLRLDLMYIEQYSLLLDIKLILMTIKILFIPESTEGVKDDNTSGTAL